MAKSQIPTKYKISNPNGSLTKRGGLTILEGIAILCILGILVALLMPTIGGRSRLHDPAYRECKKNLHQIGRAFFLYWNDLGRRRAYPPGGDVNLVNGLYSLGTTPVLRGDLDLVVCPVKGSTPPMAVPITDANCDYLFKAGGSATISALFDLAADEPIGIDKPDNHGNEKERSSVCVVYMDGHAEMIIGDSSVIDPIRKRVTTPGPTK